MFAHVVEETAEWHELGDEHHLCSETDGQDAHTAGMVDREHDPRLLQQLLVLTRRRPFLQQLDGHRDLEVLSLGQPRSLGMIVITDNLLFKF